MKVKAPIPFEFVIDELFEFEPRVQRMFGAHGVYIGEKMYFVLRESEKSVADNGIWIATDKQYHQNLKHRFPAIRNFAVMKIKKWLILPVEAENFEETAMELCQLVKDGNPAIGIVPGSSKK